MGSRALRSWAVLLALMAPLFATGTMQHAGEACKPAEVRLR